MSKEIEMPNMTRRKLLRQSGIAAGAITLLSMTPQTASAASDASSVFHVFAFMWNAGVSDAQKERARKEILAFQGVIPGLIQTHVGPNISPRGKDYTFGGIMQFTDQAALDAYVQHPSHQALLVWLRPLIDAIELDLHS
jgi:antibiotic biosynthesis monooxygenase (ABM) superfamily enzyme